MEGTSDISLNIGGSTSVNIPGLSGTTGNGTFSALSGMMANAVQKEKKGENLDHMQYTKW